MRKFPLLLAILVAPLLAPKAAYACSCMYYEDEAERLSAFYEHADLIALGTVTKTEEIEGAARIRYAISIEKTWKGEADAYVDIETARDSATCGISLPLDERVVVFARSLDGILSTGLCSGTQVLEEDDSIIAKLDAYAGPPEREEEEFDCTPYMCKNGDIFPACENGNPISYFVAPCMFSGGEIDPDDMPEEEKGFFSDVQLTHALHEAISFVKNEGIVIGYEDGTYRPDQLIDRYEFTKILIEASGGLTDSQYCRIAEFSDTDSSQWYYPYVREARCRAVVQGYENNTFGGTKNINLAEAAKIVVNTFNIEIEEEGSPWWKPYIVALSRVGGLPPRLTDPNQAITRGDMADIIYRVMMNM